MKQHNQKEKIVRIFFTRAMSIFLKRSFLGKILKDSIEVGTGWPDGNETNFFYGKYLSVFLKKYRKLISTLLYIC